MTNQAFSTTSPFKFAVTGPSVSRQGRRIIISRHVTLEAAQKAAKGKAGFEAVTIEMADQQTAA